MKIYAIVSESCAPEEVHSLYEDQADAEAAAKNIEGPWGVSEMEVIPSTSKRGIDEGPFPGFDLKAKPPTCKPPKDLTHSYMCSECGSGQYKTIKNPRVRVKTQRVKCISCGSKFHIPTPPVLEESDLLVGQGCTCDNQPDATDVDGVWLDPCPVHDAVSEGK